LIAATTGFDIARIAPKKARHSSIQTSAQILSGTEGAVPGAGHDDRSDIRVSLEGVESGHDLLAHRRVPRVQDFRPVERQPGDAAFGVKADELGGKLDFGHRNVSVHVGAKIVPPRLANQIACTPKPARHRC
jgi:hypothetical protein